VNPASSNGKSRSRGPGPVASAQPTVLDQLADIVEDHIDLAARPAPGEGIGGEQVVALRDPQLPKQQLADLAPAIAGVVVGGGVFQDGRHVHPGHLDREDRVEVLAHLDLADLRRPLPAAAQHDLGLPARDGGLDGAVVQRRQALGGQRPQGLDLRHQGREQQRLQEAGIVL
jgi:hypothetical protein